MTSLEILAVIQYNGTLELSNGETVTPISVGKDKFTCSKGNTYYSDTACLADVDDKTLLVITKINKEKCLGILCKYMGQFLVKKEVKKWEKNILVAPISESIKEGLKLADPYTRHRLFLEMRVPDVLEYEDYDYMLNHLGIQYPQG